MKAYKTIKTGIPEINEEKEHTDKVWIRKSTKNYDNGTTNATGK